MKKIKDKLIALVRSVKSLFSKIKFPKKLNCATRFAKVKGWLAKNKILSIGFILAAAAFIGGFFFKGFFIAATVNGTPISRLKLIRELEKRDGATVLNTVITEELVKQEAAKKGIKVTTQEVDGEIAKVEANLKAQNQTLAQALASSGMTLDDLRKSITLQKLAEGILADKVTVTDAEVQKHIDDNKASFPAGTNMDDAKSLIKQQLAQQKIQTEFQTWLTAVRSSAKINIFIK